MTRLVVGGLDHLGVVGAEAVIESLAASTQPVLGVATGSSPQPIYAELLRRRDELPLSSLLLFALDEYLGLEPGHPRSYRTELEDLLAHPLGLNTERLRTPDVGLPPEQASAEYEAQIAAAGGIDVQILGIGTNGHLAFNEPGSPLDSRTRAVRLDERTRIDNARFFDDPGQVPEWCITQGLATIMEAGRLVLIATGAAKAGILAAALHGPVGSEVPASVLQHHTDVLVLADEAAAAELP